MIVAIWIFAFVLIGLWSLLAWGAHGLLSFDGNWVAAAQPWLQKVPFAGWLETWFPAWQELARFGLEWLQAVLNWLGGAAPVLVWVLWAAGAGLTVIVAAILSALVALLRRKLPAPQPPAAAAT